MDTTHELTVTTRGLLDIEVTGSNLPDDEMESRLHAGGVFHAVDQEGRVIELGLDMDMESISAQVVMFERGVPPFHVGVGTPSGGLVVGKPVAWVKNEGALMTVDGKVVMEVVNSEPFDAVKHPDLVQIVAHARRHLLPEEHQAFIDTLHEGSKLDLALCVSLAAKLSRHAATHRKLCALDLSQGLTGDQEQARQALEEQLEAYAAEIPGVTGARFVHDPRGETTGFTFESGAYNSLNGSYKIPMDAEVYKALDDQLILDEELHKLPAAVTPTP